MSPRSSSPKARGSKAKGPSPDSDIYVGLLFVSVASLIVGIIFLAVELNAYQWALPTG